MTASRPGQRPARPCAPPGCAIPKKLVLAVPVAPTSAVAELRSEADDLICLEDHELFGAIGLYYADFSQVSDETVIDILKRFPAQSLENARQPAA